MKICYISNLYTPFILGGAEVYVRNIAEDLANRCEDVFIITANPQRSYKVEYINNVKIYRVPIFNVYNLYNYTTKPTLARLVWHAIDLWNLHSYFVVKKILEKERPDVVHVHNFKGFSLSVFDAIKSLRLPFIFTVHDYYLICPKTNLLRQNGMICHSPSYLCSIYIKIQKKYVVRSKPDLVTTPSQFIINKLKKYGFFKNVKTIKLPLGIKIDNRKKIRENYDIIDILYVGNLSKHKGVHILINAFKKIKQNNVRLHIIGKGKDAKKFKELAKGDSRIKFYGFVSEEQLKRMYEMANIVVVPSIWYENSPVVIYESFKHQTPVVGSRIGGIPELVEDGYNGILFEAGNSNELRSKLEYLVEDTSALKRLEKGAVESIKKYDMGKHITKLRKIYEVIS